MAPKACSACNEKGSMCDDCVLLRDKARAITEENGTVGGARTRDKSPLVSSAERGPKCQRVDISTPPPWPLPACPGFPEGPPHPPHLPKK